MLTADELAQLRGDLETLLVDTCTVTAVTRVATDAGGYTETTTTTDVACRLGPVAGRERILGGQTVAESDAVITLPWDTTVAATSRITHDGDEYEVVDIQDRTDRLVLRVFVRRS